MSHLHMALHMRYAAHAHGIAAHAHGIAAHAHGIAVHAHGIAHVHGSAHVSACTYIQIDTSSIWLKKTDSWWLVTKIFWKVGEL